MRINPDSPIIHSLSVIYDVVVTTFLFLLCCIPVVTVGAALTALQATMMEIAADTSSGVLGRFFGSFRENFKLSTLLWVPLFMPLRRPAAEIFLKRWPPWATAAAGSMNRTPGTGSGMMICTGNTGSFTIISAGGRTR